MKKTAFLITLILMFSAVQGLCYRKGVISPDEKLRAVETSVKLGLGNFVPGIAILYNDTGKEIANFFLEGKDGRKIEEGTKMIWSPDSRYVAITVIEKNPQSGIETRIPALFDAKSMKISYPIKWKTGVLEATSFSGSKFTVTFIDYKEWKDAVKLCGEKEGMDTSAKRVVKVVKDIKNAKSKEVVSKSDFQCEYIPTCNQ